MCAQVGRREGDDRLAVTRRRGLAVPGVAHRVRKRQPVSHEAVLVVEVRMRCVAFYLCDAPKLYSLSRARYRGTIEAPT